MADYSNTHTHTHTQTQTQTRARTRTHTHIHTTHIHYTLYTHIHTTHIHYTTPHTHTHSRTHTHARTHARTHTHTHIHSSLTFSPQTLASFAHQHSTERSMGNISLTPPQKPGIVSLPPSLSSLKSDLKPFPFKINTQGS